MKKLDGKRQIFFQPQGLIRFETDVAPVVIIYLQQEFGNLSQTILVRFLGELAGLVDDILQVEGGL